MTIAGKSIGNGKGKNNQRVRRLLIGMAAMLFISGCQFPAVVKTRAENFILDRAVRLENAGRYQAALGMVNLCLCFTPRHALAFYIRGILHLDLKQYPQAVEDFTASLDCVPVSKRSLPPSIHQLAKETEWLFFFRGRAYSELGDDVRALADLGRALIAKPDFDKPYLVRGAIYRRQGNPQAALADFSEAARLQPDSDKPYNERGVVYFIQGDYRNAIRDFDQAVLRNEDPILYCNRGQSYLRLGEIPPAIADFQTAIRLKSDTADAHYYLGESYARQRQPQQASNAYTRFLMLAEKLEPGEQASLETKLKTARDYVKDHPLITAPAR